MPVLFMPLLTILLFWCAACAAMPFLIVRDRRLARVKKRSLFDKSANQIAVLCTAGLLLFAIALGADVYFHGRMDTIATVLSRPVWLFFVACECVAALLAVLGKLLGRKTAGNVSWFFSGIFAFVAYLFFLIMLWGLLNTQPVAGAAIPVDLAPAVVLKAFYAAVTSWVAAFAVTGWEIPALALAFCVVLAPAAAQILALLWHIVRRGCDDFGRDYYNFVVGGRARSTAWCTILLLPFTAVLMYVTAPFAAARASVLPFATLMTQEMLSLLYNGLLILLPLAVLCCYLTGRDATPLRKRSLIFIALLLELTAVFAVLVRLWA